MAFFAKLPKRLGIKYMYIIFSISTDKLKTFSVRVLWLKFRPVTIPQKGKDYFPFGTVLFLSIEMSGAFGVCGEGRQHCHGHDLTLWRG